MVTGSLPSECILWQCGGQASERTRFTSCSHLTPAPHSNLDVELPQFPSSRSSSQPRIPFSRQVAKLAKRTVSGFNKTISRAKSPKNAVLILNLVLIPSSSWRLCAFARACSSLPSNVQTPRMFQHLDNFVRRDPRQPLAHTVTSRDVRLTDSSCGISSPISSRSST